LAFTEEFEQFIREHEKSYKNDQEKQMRFRIFLQNKRRIAQLNARSIAEGGDAVYGINGFSDLTPAEFRATYSCNLQSTRELSFIQDPVDLPVGAPSKYDWRNQGVVTAVKNQGQCGSCWAFSATEGVESANALAGNPIKVLAPQQIVSCDHKDLGCNGGNVDKAWDYVEGAGGLELESDYPYKSGTTGTSGTCNYDKSKVQQTISSYAYATKNKNESQMVTASYTYGPLSIAVDAETWSAYKSGIITSNCGKNLDHAVQIVGWDLSYSTPYWIVRNSWGSTWGESGYVRVEYNKDLCGIADDALYAIAKKTSLA
jgi:C1A family cysteine protease